MEKENFDWEGAGRSALVYTAIGGGIGLLGQLDFSNYQFMVPFAAAMGVIATIDAKLDRDWNWTNSIKMGGLALASTGVAESLTALVNTYVF